MIVCGCSRAREANCNDKRCSKYKELKPTKTYFAPWYVKESPTNSIQAAIDYANTLNWGDED